MSPVGISLLMLLASPASRAGLAQAGESCYLEPEVRWDALGAAAQRAGQRPAQNRMVGREWRPGLMHAVIFLGFMALLARKLQLIAIGYDESASFPGCVGGPVRSLQGRGRSRGGRGGAVCVLPALRAQAAAARAQSRSGAGAVADPVIMVTDLAFDGFRFALCRPATPASPTSAASPSSATRSRGVSALARRRSRPATSSTYWMQMASGVRVPRDPADRGAFPHRHRIAGLFFRRGRPANRVPGVDIEKLMAATTSPRCRSACARARDLTWKDGLDAFTCTECGRCKDACPTFLTGKPLSLKWVHDSLKHHLVEQRDAIVAKDPRNELPALVGSVISEDTLWACTTCGYCEAACPIELEHLRQVLQHAPASSDDRRRVPARTEEGVRSLGVAGQPVGAAGRAARRLGRDLDVPRATARSEGPRLPVLCRLGDVLRPARPEDRTRLRRDPEAGRRSLRHPRRA